MRCSGRREELNRKNCDNTRPKRPCGAREKVKEKWDTKYEGKS